MNEQAVLDRIKGLLRPEDTAKFENGDLVVCAERKVTNNVYIELCNMFRKRNVTYETLENRTVFFFRIPLAKT
jgi:hypothetical protein